MNKTKIIIVIVAVLLAVWGISSYSKSNSTSQTASTGQVIKIGISGPLSGSLAFAGEGIRNGAELAIHEFEKANPTSKNSYKVVMEDDGFDPKRTASALNKLISVDKVSALMTFASAAGNIANPIAEKNQIVHMGIASDPNIAKGDYNFIHWTPPFEEVRLFIEELQKRHIKKVAVFGANIQGITAVIDELEKQVQGTDIQIVSKDVFNFGTTDFRTIVAKAKATNPDIYVPIAFSPELETLSKQLKDANIGKPLTSLEGFELTDRPDLFEGYWYVNAADSSDEFRTAYKNMYGKEQVIATANAYDITKMIIDSAERASKANPGKEVSSSNIKDALYNVDIQGALGHLKIDKDGFVLTKAVTKIIQNGKPVRIED
ncbi:MAG: ABC transporter substrate-binding protein [Candidatus Pacebacteria bacterium]|nr:ABC transporter substrate-binding protein [Candidatus Paceibacterota bacterium]